MKYCRYCGAQMDDDSQYCPSCGKKVEEVVNNAPMVTEAYQQNNEYNLNNANENKSSLKLVAFILAILSCISAGLFIIPLIWMIPMTIRVYRAYKGETTLTVGFKVCTLLFLNTISGILLLCENE